MKASVAIFLLLWLFCAPAAAAVETIVPRPLHLQKGDGEFLLTKETLFFSETPLSKNALGYLQKQLSFNAGFTLGEAPKAGESTLLFRHDAGLGDEAYRLKVTKERVTLEAKSEAGFFYAMMSLMQFLPPEIWGQENADLPREVWPVGACKVEDAPRFKWRGMMLDSARNFFPKAYVKKFIDRLAQHKINTFHWHLTDDEGWRIEIKKYPLLTQTGARRGPGTKLPFTLFPAMRGPKDKLLEGYYTQEDIREIVAYAKKRSVNILPEIDIPGHAKAAVTAYPELLQDPDDKSRYTSVQKIGNNTIDAGLESSYLFLEDVISEVAALFPFGYIHLGGDEIPKGAWQQSPAVARLMQREGLKSTKEAEGYFFTRMDRILARHDRRMVVWQEADSESLRDGTIIMAWRGDGAGIRAARNRRNVVMAPAQHLYFDQQYSREKGEYGHTWAGPTDTNDAYAYEPVPKTLSPKQAAFVRGVHGCLWSETALNESIADYLAWPRILALAEIGWSDEKRRDWEDFKRRAFTAGIRRLEAQNINYRKPETY